MSSREIAELVESRHDSVKRTIEILSGKGVIVHPLTVDEQSADTMGRPRTMQVYRLDKRSSLIVVAQLCPEFTARLVDRWQELEGAPQFTIPKTYAQAMRLAADQADQIEAQQAQLALAAPKVAFVDKYVDSTGLKGFREVAKLLKASEPKFREFLKEEKIMYRLGGEWAAYAQHLDACRFEVKTGASSANGHAFNRTMFTVKGVEWIAGLWAVHCLKKEVAV